MSLRNFVEGLDTVDCSAETKVSEVAKIMRDKEVGTVLVTRNDKPVGIVTDRDLTIRCLADGKVPMDARIETIMSHPVHTVKDSASILDLVEQMAGGSVRRMCVIDNQGKPVGVVSAGDILELLSHELEGLSKAVGTRNQKLFRRTTKTTHPSETRASH